MAEFKIINIRTGKVVGNANTIGGARRSVDRNDNKYGGYVHEIRDSTGNRRFSRPTSGKATKKAKGKK